MEVYGYGRKRDRGGLIYGYNLNPYTNCLHASVGKARDNMEVLIVEVYD